MIDETTRAHRHERQPATTRAFAIAACAVALLGCGDSADEPEPSPIETWIVGADEGRGNLLGMQAWIRPQHYASAQSFEALVRTWFVAARDQQLLRANTVVILPEYVGVWLVAVDEAAGVYEAPTTTEALAQVIARDPETWASYQESAPAQDGATYAVFAMKAERMAEVYQSVFAALAMEFGATIVAGSIILPEPQVVGGAIQVQPGQPLRNASFVFGPDGSVLGPGVIKAFPTETEQPFVAPGQVQEMPVFETSIGRLAVLICADSWYPEVYGALVGQAVDVIAVPVFVSGNGYWDAPWNGYSGYPEPPDVDATDIGVLTEGEAWHRYSLPGRIDQAGVRIGMTVTLRGQPWELGSDGHALVCVDQQCLDAPEVDAPLLTNLWL